MPNLILGTDWVGPVHQLPGRPFGSWSEDGSILSSLARHARSAPEAPFLTDIGAPACALSYADAHRRVEQQASMLIGNGLQRGDRVGVLGHNSADFALAVLAVLRGGGVAVPLSPQDPPGRIGGHLEFTEARLLLHDSDCTGIAAACAATLRTWSFSELHALSQDFGAIAIPWPEFTDAALIFFTSGTTGAPKAVVQSHGAVAQNAYALAAHHNLGPDVRLLCVLPLYHVNGLEFTVLGALVGGSHTVISPGFDGLRFWDTLRHHRIDIASLVPNLLRLLASRPGLRGESDLPLRYAVSAAAPLSVGIARQVWDKLQLPIVQGYGLSEATNFSCLMPPRLNAAEYQHWMLDGRRTSVGPHLPNQQVSIQRDGATAGSGVEGQILIRGHCVMSGYLHNPAATEEVFRGGWLHTGDLGYWLPAGPERQYIHVSGRVREIAKRSGKLLSLLEIDEVLASAPGVADAACAAFSNTWVDEEIGAVVVAAPGNRVDAGVLTDYCRRLLPYAAVPKRIEVVEEIPRTPSGKVRRAEVAERFAAFREHLFVDHPAHDRKAWEA
jgi:long-chain acyl-CoA synthetase